MKVVCDACQAKYQIPDERVVGRKLKIRCRKCGGTIVVRGDNGHGDHAGLESMPPGSIEWHISLDGDQHGPYAIEQVAGSLHGGQLAWDAYVWREGYSGWKMAGESDTLVRAVAGVAAGSDESPTTTAHAPGEPSDDTPTRMVQSSPGLATDVLQPSARSAFAARSVSRASQPPHVLAAAAAAPASQPSQPPHASASSPGFAAQGGGFANARVSAEAALTGERHEDSVLFSARNLNTSPAPSPASRPGYATTEGSGLIDIRALAMLARSNQSAVAPSGNGASSTGQRPRDEVLRLANQTGAFSNLDSLAPLDRPSRAPSNAVPFAILGGSAMIAVAAGLAVYLSRPAAVTPPQPVAVATSAGEPTPSVAPQQVAAQQEAPAAADAPKVAQPETPSTPQQAIAAMAQKRPSEPAPKTDTKVVAASLAKALPKRAPVANARATKSGEPKADSDLPIASEAKATKKESSPSIDDLLGEKADAPKPAKGEEHEAVAGPQAKTKEQAHGRSIDELLDEAVPTKEAAAAKKAAAAEAAGSALPETPSREQVLSAMRAVDSDVQACAAGQTLDSTSASVALAVTGASGRPASVRVTGVPASIGSCIARAVRNASFPKFARPQFSINFPFKLKP